MHLFIPLVPWTTPLKLRWRNRAPCEPSAASRKAYRRGNKRRNQSERERLEAHHPELKVMWIDLENLPEINAGMAEQPPTISRRLKPFQLEGLAWMKGDGEAGVARWPSRRPRWAWARQFRQCRSLCPTTPPSNPVWCWCRQLP